MSLDDEVIKKFITKRGTLVQEEDGELYIIEYSSDGDIDHPKPGPASRTGRTTERIRQHSQSPVRIKRRKALGKGTCKHSGSIPGTSKNKATYSNSPSSSSEDNAGSIPGQNIKTCKLPIKRQVNTGELSLRGKTRNKKRCYEESNSDDSFDLEHRIKHKQSHKKGRYFYDYTSEEDSDDYKKDRPGISLGSIIGTTVKRSIKQKIKHDKFIEFSDLIPNYSFTKPKEFVLSMGKDNSPCFSTKPSRINISFTQWQNCFDVFMSIYLEKFNKGDSSEVIRVVKELLTYRKEISHLKENGYDWLAYDRHFRMEREAYPFPWSTTRQDLIMEHSNRPPSAF